MARACNMSADVGAMMARERANKLYTIVSQVTSSEVDACRVLSAFCGGHMSALEALVS